MNTPVLRVAVFERSPFIVKRASPDGFQWSGFCVDLLDDLSSVLDFKYELYESPDNIAGNKLPGGNWTGVIGQIVNKKADLAVSALTITSLREKVVDFTKPFMEYGNVLVMRSPSLEDRHILAFTHPFHWQVWLCIVTCMFTVGILLFLTSRLRLKMNAGDRHADNDRAFNLRNSLWFVYWSMMRKGGEPPPRSLSTRIIAGFWWLFVLIVVSTYTANLTAFLTVKRLKHPVTSLDDLASQTKVKFGIVNHGSLYDFFKAQEGTSSIYERLWYGMKANPHESFVSNLHEGMDRARQGGYAFITDGTYFVYEAMKDPDCQLSMVGAPFVYGGYGIATRNGSHWTEKLTIGILQLRELGRINTLRDRWWPRSECSLDGSDPSADASGLTLADLKGVFYLLFCGLLVGVVVALCEIYWQKTHRVKESQHSVPMDEGQPRECTEHALLRECLQKVELGEIRVVIQKIESTNGNP
ncbi:glutamate receptor ionotropic, delta-1-like [Branchiostoma lanceolatum]|uniref:GRIK3 protein n=1 Tax=Branchiostoma lanceolatum TaxID=7740 RepID=A0A8J9W7U0_BRALA|nr:GRIK3 [Branchiostoma lanceolatum]